MNGGWDGLPARGRRAAGGEERRPGFWPPTAARQHTAGAGATQRVVPCYSGPHELAQHEADGRYFTDVKGKKAGRKVKDKKTTVRDCLCSLKSHAEPLLPGAS